MPESVHQTIADTAPFVLARAVDNLQICQTFMGILGKTVWEAHRLGRDIFKVEIGEPVLCGHHFQGTLQLRAKVWFHKAGISTDLGFMGRVDGIREFVMKQSQHMGMVVEKNPTYLKFLQRSVEILEDYALRHGIQFERIEIRHGFLSADNYIVLEIV